MKRRNKKHNPGTATEESLQTEKAIRDAKAIRTKLNAMTYEEKEKWYNENAISFEDLFKKYNLTEDDLHD